MQAFPTRTSHRTTGAARTVPGMLLLVASLLAGVRAGAAAQDPPSPLQGPPIGGTWDVVQSIGQPRTWLPHLTLDYGAELTHPDGAAGPGLTAGVLRHLFNPVIGSLALGLQTYVAQRGEEVGAGARVTLESPATFLHAGLDWDLAAGRWDPVLGLTLPVRRGGWPLPGSHLRVNWTPARDQRLAVGVQIPVRQPLAGRTRSTRVDVEMPRRSRRRPPDAGPLKPASAAALADLADSFEWLGGLHGFFWLANFASLGHDATVEETRRALRLFRSELADRGAPEPGVDVYDGEARRYHENLDRLFGVALGSGPGDPAWRGRPLADRARQVILEEVVFPYNRAIGQYKQPDDIEGLAARARARFIAWLEIGAGLPEMSDGARREILAAFDGWLAGFEALRERMQDLKRDNRMHWIPLALVLRPDEHETQAQVDALIERGLGRTFRHGTEAIDIDAGRFSAELRRTIREAETYHVLWIHDYRGRNGNGNPDREGFLQTRTYLEALLHNVRAYDDMGRLPVFMILLDQHFYEENRARLWLDVLERPLTHQVRLTAWTPDMAVTISALQDSLRSAVAESRRLQAEATAFGQSWIPEVVKVHINVTNPSDFSFRTRRLLGRPPIGADNMMRDHRKMVIRDVTEADPGSGEVILAGVGVGEHYASETWDDRGLILRGPAALEAKSGAREVLERHGLVGSRLPAPLRPVTPAEDWAERVRARQANGATARVLQVHNRVGWGPKDATFVQMLLYDLVPPGTVIYVPDSLWTSYEWMAQLVTAAFRGCHVLVMAPSLDNAPSPGFVTMSTTQELFTRVILVAEEFGDLIRRAGGDLRVGMYSRTSTLDDLPALLADVDSTLAANPFLRDLFPLADRAADVLAAHAIAPDGGPASGRAPPERRPKLHRKTQLIISRDLLQALARRPEMAAALDEAFAGPSGGDASAGGGAAGSGGLAHLASAYRELEAEGSVVSPILYFLGGSLNKNVRSMALDGEVLAVIAGPWALQAYVDFLLLSGGASWMYGVDDLDVFLPPFSRLQRRLARWLHRIL